MFYEERVDAVSSRRLFILDVTNDRSKLLGSERRGFWMRCGITGKCTSMYNVKQIAFIIIIIIN